MKSLMNFITSTSLRKLIFARGVCVMLGLAALAVVLAVLAHWLHRRLTRPFRGLLEVFAPLPVIGTLHVELYSKSRPFVAAEVAEAHFAKHGGRRLWTEWLPVMGRFLVVADQREAVRLLKAMGSPESLLMRHRFVHNNYQAVFLTATQNSWGDDWAWRRKVLAPHFLGNRLQSAAVFPAIQEEVDTLLAELDQAATSGQPIELPLFFSQFTLRVMMRIFLGAPLEADLKNVQRWLEDHADCFIARVALPSFLTGKQEKTKQASQEAFKKLLMPELRAAMAEGRGIAGQAAQREPRVGPLIFCHFLFICCISLPTKKRCFRKR
jgi:cytochrome P450